MACKDPEKVGAHDLCARLTEGEKRIEKLERWVEIVSRKVPSEVPPLNPPSICIHRKIGSIGTWSRCTNNFEPGHHWYYEHAEMEA